MKHHASPKVFDEAMESFISLFYDDKTIEINQETISRYYESYEHFHAEHADLMKTWTKREEIELTLPMETTSLLPEEVGEKTEYQMNLTPRPVQKEVLVALEQIVAEDYSKAMVVMATGLGKTYLAAFFAKKI